MIQLKRFTSCILLFTLGLFGLQGQNLYDKEHTSSFAQFLLQSQQYHLAAIELERLVFLDQDNQIAKIQLVSAYRKSNNWEQGIRKLSSWNPDLDFDESLAHEWIKLLLLNHNFDQASSYLSTQSPFSGQVTKHYLLASSLLHEDFDFASQLISDPEVSKNPENSLLLSHLNTQQQYKYKKPGLALGLSAVVPGLGKVYTKDWKDGLISLLFVATNAWQAYRGFSQNGTSSVYGWIFGTMAVGFYGSNLYGSWKSAQDYNLRLNSDLHHEIEQAVYSRF